MMNKRGATHADWAISMGIFVVYVLSMFIFIQPGAQKVFREDNLIKIVENGVRDASEFVIERTPLFLSFTGTEEIEKKLSENNGELDIFIKNPPFEGDNNDIRLFDADANEVPVTLKEGRVIFYDKFANVDPTTIYTFYFYYLKDGYPGSLAFDDTRGEDNDVYENYFTANFGSTEELRGLSEDALANLCPDYETLKSEWGYPVNKDFNIYYVLAGSTEKNYLCPELVPYEQASVFVKELVTSFMDELGGRKQVRINMRVW